jgi:glucose-6-phosphate-specific signal transduction histidine kinase
MSLCRIATVSISTQVFLSVEDNGQGFSAGAPRGFGLQGMQERVAALDGSFSIRSEPQNGCRIVVRLPIENGAHRPENESVESINSGEWEYSSVVLE